MDRIQQLKGAITDAADECARKGKRPKVAVLFNGDMLDDVLAMMHESQLIYQDVRAEEQLELCARSMAEVVAHTITSFRCKVDVLSLGGNHDRSSKQRDGDTFRKMHRILMVLFSAYMQNYVDDKLVTITYPKASTASIQAAEKVRLIATHGDRRFKSERAVRIEGLNFAGFKVLVKGHFHKRGVNDLEGGMEVIMPSLMGGSIYSINELCCATQPGQGYLYISQIKGVPFVNPRFIDLY